MASLNLPKLDPSSFHQISNPNEEDKCPICLDQMKKKTQVVGHLFQEQVVHIVHAECWKNYAQSEENQFTYNCVVCRGIFIGPTQSPSSQGSLTIAEKKLLFFLALSENRHLPTNSRSWEEGVKALADLNLAEWLLELTMEKKQKLSLLPFFSTFAIEDLEWFLALSAEQSRVILSLGVNCLKLPTSDREWFLRQAQIRRHFIVSFCTPTIDFIHQEKSWLEKISESEMIKLDPLLKKLDSALWDARGGILGNVLKKIGHGIYDSFLNWLSGSKQNQEVGRRKTHLILMREMQNIGYLGNLSPSRKALSMEEKKWLCGVYSLDKILYQAISMMISPYLSSTDRSWLNEEKIDIPSDNYELIKKLQIPHTLITWHVNNQRGEVLEDSFASHVKRSKLPSKHISWLLSLNSEQKRALLSLNSSNFEEQRKYLELNSEIRKFLEIIKVTPEAFFQEQKWFMTLEKNQIEKARRAFWQNLSLFSEKKLDDASQARDRIEFLLKCDELSPVQKNFLQYFCASPERFFSQEKKWLMDLTDAPTLRAVLELEVEKAEEPREARRRFELVSMPIAKSAIEICISKSYSRKLQELEKEWFSMVAIEDKELFAALIRKGVEKGIFCGNDLRSLLAKGTFEKELFEQANATYNKNLELGYALDPKVIATGYVIGFAATRITNSNPILTAISLLASMILFTDLYNENTFEQGAHAVSLRRSFQIGSAAALSVHSLDTRIVLLAGGILGGAIVLMFLAFLKFLDTLGSIFTNKRQ